MRSGLSDGLSDIDRMLMRDTGMNLLTLGFRAIGADASEVDVKRFKAASVPITSGLGIIGGFSRSVADIVRDMGIDCFVTEHTDVWGFGEAIDRGADIILMADDEQYMAYSVAAGRYANNSFCTAAGYVEALRGAVGGLQADFGSE